MAIGTNKLTLSGIVHKTPVRKVSPSGIPHCQFMLDHRSMQQEAGYQRQAWCRMPVIMSGESAKQQIAVDLTAGSVIQVRGFISSYQNASGLRKLVLHAEEIKLTHSGDQANGTLFSPP